MSYFNWFSLCFLCLLLLKLAATDRKLDDIDQRLRNLWEKEK